MDWVIGIGVIFAYTQFMLWRLDHTYADDGL